MKSTIRIPADLQIVWEASDPEGPVEIVSCELNGMPLKIDQFSQWGAWIKRLTQDVARRTIIRKEIAMEPKKCPDCGRELRGYACPECDWDPEYDRELHREAEETRVHDADLRDRGLNQW